MYSTEYLRANADTIDWRRVVETQQLDESIIREFADLLNWRDVSRCQKLSPRMLFDYSKRLYMPYVGRYQTFSLHYALTHMLEMDFCENIRRCIREENERQPIVVDERYGPMETAWINSALYGRDDHAMLRRIQKLKDTPVSRRPCVHGHYY